MLQNSKVINVLASTIMGQLKRATPKIEQFDMIEAYGRGKGCPRTGPCSQKSPPQKQKHF